MRLDPDILASSVAFDSGFMDRGGAILEGVIANDIKPIRPSPSSASDVPTAADAAERLREVRAALDACPVGLVFAQLGQQHLRANRAAARLIGADELGDELDPLPCVLGADALGDALLRDLLGNPDDSCHVRPHDLLGDGGAMVPIALSTRPVRGASGEVIGVLAVLVDRVDRSSRPSPAVEKLTARECEVLRLVALGKTSGEIGQALDISTRTVDAHRRNIMVKLDLKGTAALTRFAIRHGLCD